MQTLYQIALPLYDNQGESYEGMLKEWEYIALRVAGGYTKNSVGEGVWQDPQTGVRYRDSMQPYTVACNPAQFGALVHAAFDLFPDQVAIFTAQVGEATIINRTTKEG